MLEGNSTFLDTTRVNNPLLEREIKLLLVVTAWRDRRFLPKRRESYILEAIQQHADTLEALQIKE